MQILKEDFKSFIYVDDLILYNRDIKVTRAGKHLQQSSKIKSTNENQYLFNITITNEGRSEESNSIQNSFKITYGLNISNKLKSFYNMMCKSLNKETENELSCP